MIQTDSQMLQYNQFEQGNNSDVCHLSLKKKEVLPKATEHLIASYNYCKLFWKACDSLWV